MQYSFEELDKAMSYLSHVLEFHDDAMELSHRAKQELSRPTGQREAAGVLAAIGQLEPRLEILARC
jgi:hypothetical protein